MKATSTSRSPCLLRETAMAARAFTELACIAQKAVHSAPAQRGMLAHDANPQPMTVPHPPPELHGRVLVLQHPHEEKLRLGTVKLLRKCLANCDVLVGRNFNVGRAPLLDAVLADAAEGRCPLYVLYPGPGACPLDEIVRPAPRAGSEAVQPAYTLLLVDGTWPQAREMMNKLAPRVLPPTGPGIAVQLPEFGPSACLLRKEKREGNVMTMEAAARALGALERNDAVCDQLLAPLKRMTALQAGWSPAIKSSIAPALQTPPDGKTQEAAQLK